MILADEDFVNGGLGLACSYVGKLWRVEHVSGPEANGKQVCVRVLEKCGEANTCWGRKLMGSKLLFVC